MKCCICTKEIEKQKSPDGHVYWDKGHNPVPLKDAGIHVIPARLDAFLQGRSTDLPSKT